LVVLLLVLVAMSSCAPVMLNETAAPLAEVSQPAFRTDQPAPRQTQTSPPEGTATPTPAHTSTPAPSLTPTEPACWLEGGYYDHASLETELLRHPLDVRVFVPPCYQQQPDRRYPVLYLIHGQSFSDDQWDRLGVDEHLNALIARRELPPFLVVMPRDREWTQSDQDPFGKAFIEVLLPWVEETYRTIPERNYRAVGGLSRGAGWAVHFGLRYWDVFGAIGAHSLPVFWSDVPSIKNWLSAIPPESTPRIYLDIGDQDRPEILKSATWFEELLTRQGISHEWHLFTGYHDEAYWSAHVEQYLRWYAQGFE
jgi:enterochelin esterase-like enzyme